MDQTVTTGTGVRPSPPLRNTAVFIDMENLFGGYAGEVRGVPVKRIIAEIRRIGTELGVVSDIAIMRAYANWADGRLGVYRRELMEVGIEPIQVFGFGASVKNAADIELVVDALSTVYEAPFIEVVVVVSGDGGFVPLVRHLHALGKYVLVVSTPSPPPNKLLRAVADYCHLVGDRLTAERSDDDIPRTHAETPARSSPLAESARELVRTAVRAEPELVKAGVINTALLGNRVRELDPGFMLSGTGYRTLTALASDAIGATQAATPVEPASTAGPPFPDVDLSVPSTRSGLRESLHRVIRADGWNAWFAHQSTDGALPVQRLLHGLDQKCPRYSSCLKQLFPVAKLALRYGLQGSGFALTTQEGGAILVVADDAGGAVLRALDDDDLASPQVLIEALSRCTPPIRIPDTVLFGDLVEAVLGLPARPVAFSSVVETCADSLEEWPADMVRVSLVTLVTLGILRVADDAQTDLPFESREHVVAAGFRDVDDVLREVGERVGAALAPYAWPPATALIELLSVEHITP